MRLLEATNPKPFGLGFFVLLENQGCEQHGTAVWCDEQPSGLFVRARGSTGSPLWQGAFAASLLYVTNPDVWEM